MPSANGKAIAWLYANGEITEEGHEEDGMHLVLRMSDKIAGQFEKRYPDVPLNLVS